MRKLLLSLVLLAGLAQVAGAAVFQYSLPAKGVYMWIPPKAEHVRGVIIAGQTLIEKTFVQDPDIRAAAEEQQLAIVFMLKGGFDMAAYKATGMQPMLAELAKLSGYPELEYVPLMTVCHSAAGEFGRNVAYYHPERCFGVVYIKSGNIKPPADAPDLNFAGVPFLAISGQLEEFGPDGGIKDGVTHEIQWTTVRDTLVNLRTGNNDYLTSMIVDPGAGHFPWWTIDAKYTAMFIRKAAQARLPAATGDVKAPVVCKAIKAESGWLSDANLTADTRETAAYNDYQGDKAKALWYFDEEIARANEKFNHANFGKLDQMVSFNDAKGKVILPTQDARSVGAYLDFTDAKDATVFKLSGSFLENVPGYLPNNGAPLGHAAGPVLFRAADGPLAQTGPDTFRIQLDTLNNRIDKLYLLAYHPGDDKYRHCEQVSIPGRYFGKFNTNGKAQTITFPALANVKTDATPIELKATADSALPVEFYVTYGPAVIKDGKVTITDVPAGTKYPIEIGITAYNLGTRGPGNYAAAAPVTVTFQVEK